MRSGNQDKVYVGARRLSTEEATRLLPNFIAIEEKLKQIRTGYVMSEVDAESTLSSAEHNNIISILGKRGAGKTSILYTVANELKDDIILPLIKPDNITSSNHIIASVLGLIKKEIDRMIKEDDDAKKQRKQKSDFENCIYRSNEDLNEQYNKVLEYYCYTNSEYKQVLLQNYSNFTSYTQKSSQVLNADYEFIGSLHKLINQMLLRVQKRDSGDVNPLLIIMIDDIDLHTQKVEQVVDVLLAYLNHPRVACVISADYDTLIDSLINFIFKKR